MYKDAIYTTYTTNFEKLSVAKQFHLATRLQLWLNDTWAREQLDELKPLILGGYTEQEYQAKLRSIGKIRPDLTQINAGELRGQLFNLNPWLYGTELQLFHALHAHVQYNTDLRHNFGALSEEKVQSLVNDPYQLLVLATFAVDIYYLYWRFIREDDSPLIPLETIKQALDVNNLDTFNKFKLQIYLLTHCIIGETLFYSRPIPKKHQSYYRPLLALASSMAESHWDEITLDTKLELAVCHQIISNGDYPLRKRSTDEANRHFDKTRGYITDPKVPHKNDLEWAEHRNILYIMANSTQFTKQPNIRQAL